MRATILLFEDDPDIRCLVTDLLDEKGYEVYPVYSLEQACRLVRSVKLDLCLTDSGVPHRELALEHLRTWCEQLYGHVPVIVLTAHNISREEARELGALEVIRKPFDVHELLMRVEEGLRESSSAGVESASTHD